MATTVKQLKDKGTGQPFVPVTHWDAVAGKPTIPDAQVLSDWNLSSSSAIDYIKNKPTALSSFTDDLGNSPVHTHNQYLIQSLVETIISNEIEEITYEGMVNDIDKLFAPELVDLGLPSGTLWVKTNIGASVETDPGFYVAWGELKQHEGWMLDKTTHPYSWSEYTKFTNGVYSNSNKKVFTKYVPTSLESTYWNGNGSADNKLILDPEDDIATLLYGSNYKIPGWEEFVELDNLTNREWTTINGVNGWKFTNKNDSTKYVFLPEAGYCLNLELNLFNAFGYYWCSNIYLNNASCAYSIGFDSSDTNLYNSGRLCGFSIRPIYK